MPLSFIYLNIPKKQKHSCAITCFLACEKLKVLVWSCNKIYPVKMVILNESTIWFDNKESHNT